MVENERRRAFHVVAAAAAFILVAGTAWAQPPVAKPQPPPKAPTAGSTSPTPQTTQPAPAAPAPAGQAVPAPTGASAKPVSPAAGPASPSTAVPVRPSTAAAPRATAAGEQSPTASMLGVSILPNAEYLGSYDAGGAGQRFYLYGTGQRFADVVGYYSAVLKDKGELVFEFPATHMFEVGKFREDQVAFPPGVTVKDYTFAGSPGLANPKPGATPVAFPTIIQIVPPATAPAARPR